MLATIKRLHPCLLARCTVELIPFMFAHCKVQKRSGLLLKITADEVLLPRPSFFMFLYLLFFTCRRYQCLQIEMSKFHFFPDMRQGYKELTGVSVFPLEAHTV